MTVALLLGLGAACRGGGDQPVALHGAGATFPYPLYSKWVSEYERVDPRARINYQSIGSGGGIRQISERTVDFGASDAPMTDAELSKLPGQLLHIPTTLGAVVVVINLPGVGALRLDGPTLAAIFLGEVKRWDDPRIAALNPGTPLPAADLIVVHRSDGSGTTAVFTEYLARQSRAFKEKVGSGPSVRWPLGVGAKGNEGVTGQVKTTPGTLGYTELAYAIQNKLAVASLRNRAGEFVAPTLESIAKAAQAAAGTMPDDLRISIVDSDGAGAYPIAAFSYILCYAEQKDLAKGQALARFLHWATHQGQDFSASLHYVPLPAPVVQKIEARLGLLRHQGNPLLQPAQAGATVPSSSLVR